jgi:hypothetical protein
VRRFRGCLGSLPSDQRELLGLRAGLDGPPQSRSAAAESLGISTSRAARLERSGLSTLRGACGSSGGGGVSAVVDAVVRPDGMPDLEPATYLVASSAPDLESQSDLADGRKRGAQGVEGASESSPSEEGAPSTSAAPAAAATPSPLGDGGSAAVVWPWIVVAALIAAGMLVLLLNRRRTAPATASPRNDRVTAATAVAPVPAPTRAPEPEPQPQPEPQPTATSHQQQPEPTADDAPTQIRQTPTPPDEQATEPAQPTVRVTRRSGGLIGRASGIASLAARELKRRRSG